MNTICYKDYNNKESYDCQFPIIYILLHQTCQYHTTYNQFGYIKDKVAHLFSQILI